MPRNSPPANTKPQMVGFISIQGLLVCMKRIRTQGAWARPSGHAPQNQQERCAQSDNFGLGPFHSQSSSCFDLRTSSEEDQQGSLIEFLVLPLQGK